MCAIFVGGICWLVKSMVDSDKRTIDEYRKRVNTHCVEVHFKDGNVQQFNKNITIDVDSTKPFGRGELFYVLKPSGTTIPYDIVKYAEVKEMQ